MQRFLMIETNILQALKADMIKYILMSFKEIIFNFNFIAPIWLPEK
jgi:hypothetical protein